jgi:hypothetical protein
MRFGGTVIPSLWRSWSRRLAASVGSYRELCVWVPRVHVAGVRDAHSFVLGMLTDGKLARFADLALGYGYDKRPGRFAVVSPLDFEVSTGADASVVAFSGMSSSSRRVDASEVTEIEADWGNPLLGVTRSGRLARSQLRRSLSTATLLEGLGGELRAAHGFFPGGRSRYVFPEPTGDGGWHVLRFENVRADVGYPTSL